MTTRGDETYRRARSTRTTLALSVALVSLAFFAGCDALKEHQCCLFKPGGIFAQDQQEEVERLRRANENDIVARASAATYERKDPWEPTDAELRYASANRINVKDYVWSPQRPNGGVLFPRELKRRGPVVVMEPSIISAPVGTDIVLVASYVSADNEHMTVGERLDWNLSGVGQFVSTNPTNSTAILQCPCAPTSRASSGASQTTETSGELYRLTRGTKSTEDDITILRGQSWTAVTSYDEGTSTVVVEGSNVPDWGSRRASAQIHWIDAAFKYPKSAVGPVDRPGILETTVVRRSTSEPRVDWPVRYEVLSGEGGFDSGNGQLQRSVVVPTAANGKAAVRVGQVGRASGTTRIKVSIYRPGTADYPQAIVDSRTINYTWTTAAPLGLQVIAPDYAAAGSEVHYKIYINNFSEFYYTADVEINIPLGARFVNISPPVGSPSNPQQDPQRQLHWRVANIQPNSYIQYDLILRKEHDGPITLEPRLYNASPSNTATSINSGGAVNPPVTR